MMKVLCKTFFDCGRTGVTGNFRIGELPFRDRDGQQVENFEDWNRSRNQQRNYETLVQIFGLRTQPMDITQPTHNNDEWTFEFDSENAEVFSRFEDPDPLASLKADCEGVPMMTNLRERTGLIPTLSVSGPDQNIWFELVNI